jgi:hypothetical protein
VISVRESLVHREDIGPSMAHIIVDPHTPMRLPVRALVHPSCSLCESTVVNGGVYCPRCSVHLSYDQKQSLLLISPESRRHEAIRRVEEKIDRKHEHERRSLLKWIAEDTYGPDSQWKSEALRRMDIAHAAELRMRKDIPR